MPHTPRSDGQSPILAFTGKAGWSLPPLARRARWVNPNRCRESEGISESVYTVIIGPTELPVTN